MYWVLLKWSLLFFNFNTFKIVAENFHWFAHSASYDKNNQNRRNKNSFLLLRLGVELKKKENAFKIVVS